MQLHLVGEALRDLGHLHDQVVACLDDCLGRGRHACRLHLQDVRNSWTHLDDDVLLERMRLFVAGEPHPLVKQELVAHGVAQGVVLIPDSDQALVALAAVLFIGDSSTYEADSLTLG